jgi:hypothetical protein
VSEDRDPFDQIPEAVGPTPAATLKGAKAGRHVAAVADAGQGATAYTADPPEPVALRRRMPEYLRRFLLRVQGGRLYLPAAQRLVWFRDECPDWGITTEMIEGGQEAGFATVRATVSNPEGRVIASGLKTETRQDFPAGWVEKAETGAIARALAVAGFGTQFSPELDEGEFADAPQMLAQGVAPPPPSTRLTALSTRAESAAASRRVPVQVWDGPGQCPQCHAPTGKKHARKCSLASV